MKTDGIASAAYALRYWERRQEVTSNNLANVNTTGFKGERVFARLVAEGLPVAEAATDLTEGTFTPTGNPLDLAQRGNNYFVVNTANGERWTRGGSCGVDPQGYLVDQDGNQLLGEKGPIKAAGKNVEIDRSGWVVVDQVRVDRLRVESPAAGAVLQHEGGSTSSPTRAARMSPTKHATSARGNSRGATPTPSPRWSTSSPSSATSPTRRRC